MLVPTQFTDVIFKFVNKQTSLGDLNSAFSMEGPSAISLNYARFY